MKLRIYSIIALAGVLLAGFSACQKTERGKYVQGADNIYCDDGFRQVLDEEIEVFEYQYKDASIIPFYVSETEALNKMLDDEAQSIITSRELTKDQIKYIKDKYKRVVRQKCIAVDAVALIVNKDNPLTQLSMKEIGEIMRGELKTWNQLDAKGDTTRIKLVFDNAGSSTVSFMRDKFLGGKGDISKNALAQSVKNNAQVFDYVKKDPNAIGILSVSWLGIDLGNAKKVPVDKRMEDYQNSTDTIGTTLTEEVKIIKVSNPTEANDFDPVAYKPYQAYIATGDYPLFRKVFMASTASNGTVLHSFYTFVTGFIGQKIITTTGILPNEMHKRVVNLTVTKQ